MTADGRRPRRVGDLIRAELARALVRELGDPALSQAVVTDVTVSDDLSMARVGVRLLVDDADPIRRRELLRALGRAGGRLRRVVGPAVRLRRTPELRFVYDTGPDAQRRVEELLDEIAHEPRSEDDDRE